MKVNTLISKLLTFLIQNGISVTQDNKALTKNKTGAMVANLSDISKSFIYDSQSLSVSDIVVDIGCSYGVATLLVLSSSVCKVVALDAENTHIALLHKFLQQHYPDFSLRVNLVTGFFPEDLVLQDQTVKAIHASHLLQFLPGEQIIKGLQKCYEALCIHGKIYLSSTSIYSSWLSGFAETYNNNIGQMQWPGEIHDFQRYVPIAAKPFVGDFFHVLNKEQLCNMLEMLGFVIESCYYYDLLNPEQHNLNHGEMLGVIASKKPTSR